MSPEQVAAAWRRELRRVAPGAPAALQQWIAEQLADATADALAQLGRDLIAIASVVFEEAESGSRATAEVIPFPLPDRPDDFPPAAA
jgi:hypothetical protein